MLHNHRPSDTEMLIRSVIDGDLGTVQELSKSTNLDSRVNKALEEAAFRGDLEALQTLLNSPKVQPLLDKGIQTALYLATGKGYLDIVQALLNSATVLTKLDYSIREVFLKSANDNQPHILQALLNSPRVKGILKHASVNNINLALQTAASKGYENVVKILLNSQTVQESLNGGVNEALRNAVNKGHFKIARTLLNSPTAEEWLDIKTFVMAAKSDHDTANSLLNKRSFIFNNILDQIVTNFDYAESIIKELTNLEAKVENKSSILFLLNHVLQNYNNYKSILCSDDFNKISNIMKNKTDQLNHKIDGLEKQKTLLESAIKERKKIQEETNENIISNNLSISEDPESRDFSYVQINKFHAYSKPDKIKTNFFGSPFISPGSAISIPDMQKLATVNRELEQLKTELHELTPAVSKTNNSYRKR